MVNARYNSHVMRCRREYVVQRHTHVTSRRQRHAVTSHMLRQPNRHHAATRHTPPHMLRPTALRCVAMFVATTPCTAL